MTAMLRSCVAFVVVTASLARADTPAAEVAYKQAKELADAGKFAEACPLFEASWKADPQLGVLLNLADCHDKIGRAASAWAEFHDAADRARKVNDPRLEYAEKRADALVARLATLHVVPPKPAIPGLVVRRDDADITMLVASNLPIDPGEHELAASAPGYLPWSVKITIADSPKTTEVIIPPLAKNPDAKPDEATARVAVPTTLIVREDTGATRHSRHVIGLSIGLTGVAFAAVGGFFGLDARSKWNDAKTACGGMIAACPSGGLDQARSDVGSARTSALVSTIGMTAGGVAVVVGAIVYLSAPSGERAVRTAVRITPAIDARAAGLVLSGGW